MRYQALRNKRQFLAGVICTQCQKQDTTVHVQSVQPKDEWIECIACGHSERRPSKDELPSKQSNVGVVKFLP